MDALYANIGNLEGKNSWASIGCQSRWWKSVGMRKVSRGKGEGKKPTCPGFSKFQVG
ncbi:hypothetical protein WN55_08614 [Dufourea novaeangliae]|uniref:Uncharacterized protein n=1 Tax=Dufourea novaeangliae TaxID=178035 RepID=A0A154PV22_DUFNO|nr:hypothetical protein WN55_08614 [Dufourea novaeangliae]